jgi:predicted amidophosphoribosyltransferase
MMAKVIRRVLAPPRRLPALIPRGCRRCRGPLYRDGDDYTCLLCSRTVPVEPYVWCFRCGGPLEAEGLGCLLCDRGG